MVVRKAADPAGFGDDDPYVFDSPLTFDAIVRINRLMLELAAWPNDRPHQVLTPMDIRMALQLAQEYEDPFKSATMLCIAIIITHPFADGNHRTSFFAAQMLLLTRKWWFAASDAQILDFYKWRFRHERRRGLKRRWLSSIAGWDRPDLTKRYIREFMNDVYSRTIERFLRRWAEPVAGNRDLLEKMQEGELRRVDRLLTSRDLRLLRRGKRPPPDWKRPPVKARVRRSAISASARRT